MKLVQPEDFFTDTPPPRIMGSEMEHTLSGLSGNAKSLDYNWLTLMPDVAKKSSFIQNGARFYVDLMAFETTTPELLTAREIAVYESASEEILLHLAAAGGAMTQTSVDVFRRTGNYIPYESTDDFMYKTSGYHANFCMPRSVSKFQFMPTLASHLATSAVLFGEGALALDGASFIVSQKAQSIGQAIGTTRTLEGDKPMVMDPEGEFTNSEADVIDWQRVEVRCFDANIDPFITYMQFATTSLVLRLIEQKMQPTRIELCDPVNALRTISKNYFKGMVLRGTEARMKPLELQRALAEAALKMSEKVQLPKEEAEAAQQWFDIADGALADPDSLDEIATWRRKELLLEHARERGKTTDALREIDIKCEKLGPKGIANILRAQTKDRLYITPEEVNTAIYNPPTDTRAYGRGLFVKANAKNNRANVPGWTRWHYDNGRTRNVENPYDVTGFLGW